MRKFIYNIDVPNKPWFVKPKSLTVLAYHRVDDVTRPGFDTFTPIAVSPRGFERQVDYIKGHYNVISCQHLVDWLGGKRELPPYAAMITFDDGYYDNYAYAYPILRARNLPAIFFLTTNHIGKGIPFSWDQVAYSFTHSQKNSGNLPLLGPTSWTKAGERKIIIKRWDERLKDVPDAEKQRTLESLAEALEITLPEEAFTGLHMSWEHVREISQNGFEFGSHTESHPILSSITPERLEKELVGSKQKIEGEIGKPVIGLAYPNGREKDFSLAVMKMARQAGYDVAFSLTGGCPSFDEVRQNPMAIRRIFINASDTFPRFVAKLKAGRLLTSVKGWIKKK